MDRQQKRIFFKMYSKLIVETKTAYINKMVNIKAQSEAKKDNACYLTISKKAVI